METKLLILSGPAVRIHAGGRVRAILKLGPFFVSGRMGYWAVLARGQL